MAAVSGSARPLSRSARSHNIASPNPLNKDLSRCNIGPASAALERAFCGNEKILRDEMDDLNTSYRRGKVGGVRRLRFPKKINLKR